MESEVWVVVGESLGFVGGAEAVCGELGDSGRGRAYRRRVRGYGRLLVFFRVWCFEFSVCV